ncbi:MAG: hypothetical protein ABJA37_10340, partial [Ferruginibacter sp.]
IYPSSARVKVNGSLRLSIRALEPLEEDGDDELAPLTNAPIEQILKWSVNAIDKGNSTVGLISASENTTAIYQAPAQVPAQNPVAVSVEQQFSASFLRRHQVSKLISNITVYDGDYEVKMISTMDGAAGSQLGAVKYSDNGSFIVSLKDNKAKITEIVNTNAAFTYNGKCTIVLLKPGQGNINILGVQNIRVISATSPSDNAWVEIFFVRSPTIFPILQFTCPDLKGGTFTTNSAMATGIGMSIPAFPQSIKFEAKEGEQTILKMGEEGGKIYAKFTVRQIKDD